MKKKKNSLLVTALLVSSLTIPQFALCEKALSAIIQENTTITGNISGQSSTNYGGAYLIIDPNSTTTERSDLNVAINNAVFESNKATGSGYGGAIFVQDGTVTINNSTFSNNNATWDGGAISSATPHGGSPDSGPKLVINNSIFENNTVNTYSGGALGLYSEAEITGSKFINNNAGGNNPTSNTDGGGAIYIGGYGQVKISDSEFTGNSSNRGGAIGTTAAGQGSDHYLQISNTTFKNNTATEDGGAYITHLIRTTKTIQVLLQIPYLQVIQHKDTVVLYMPKH